MKCQDKVVDVLFFVSTFFARCILFGVLLCKTMDGLPIDPHRVDVNALFPSAQLTMHSLIFQTIFHCNGKSECQPPMNTEMEHKNHHTNEVVQTDEKMGKKERKIK